MALCVFEIMNSKDKESFLRSLPKETYDDIIKEERYIEEDNIYTVTNIIPFISYTLFIVKSENWEGE